MKTFLASVATVTAVVLVAGAARAGDKPVQLNQKAFEFAQELIRNGSVVADQKGAWRLNQPSIARKNDFMRSHGPKEYAKWHLGMDSRHRIGTKAHYKFPFGDFANVHRCGLLAVKARAHEYGYTEVETAATQLLQLIDSIVPGRQKRIN